MARRQRRKVLTVPARRWIVLAGTLVLNPGQTDVVLHQVPLDDVTRLWLGMGICSLGHTLASTDDLVVLPSPQWDRPPRVLCRRCADEVLPVLTAEQHDVLLNRERARGRS